MFRHALAAALLAGSLLAGLTPALAESSRLALVIGQSAYRSVMPLPNPANDANAMAKMLGEAGFDVTIVVDLSQKDLNREVGDFAAKIATKGPETVALVFYAGHGLQIDGENYLVPVDVDPRREADIPLQAVRLNDVLNTLNSVPSRMRILLLDACRNNPFPSISQSAGRGLALLDTKSGAPGTFLSYSTSPGAEAEDGNGANSPYTTAVLQAAREPGLPIEEAFKRVRVDEWKRNLQGKPIEAANEMIVGDGSVEAYEAFVTLYTAPPFGPQARQWLDLHNRMAAWNEAVLINTVASYQTFLDRYPDSDLTPTARKLIERLRNRPVVTPVAAVANAAIPVSPPVVPTNAALGPTCPCSPSPRKLDTPKRAEEKPAKKRAEDPPNKRAGRAPRYRDPGDDVVVYAPPPRDYYPPPVRVVPPAGISIGIGIGGGYGGGGYGRGPVTSPTQRGYGY